MCLPMTPVGQYILDGEASFTSIETAALSQYWPVNDEVLTISNIAFAANQPISILEVVLTETATSAVNMQKKDLLVLIYKGTSAPTTPVASNVYNASETNLISVVKVATEDYIRISDTKWHAVVRPTETQRVGKAYGGTGTGAGALNLYVIVLADEAVTYAASAGIKVGVTIGQNYGSSSQL